MSELVSGTIEYLRQVSAIEAGALIFGLSYVLLASRERVLCWPVGILGSVLAMVIASKSNYVLDVVKEGYYVLMGIYGWYSWVTVATDDEPGESRFGFGTKSEPESDAEQPGGGHGENTLIGHGVRPIVSYGIRELAIIVGAGSALSILIGYLFHLLGTSLPYLDAGTTVFSFITTWMVTQKVLQNWLFWIVINAVSFYMYVLNGFYAFSSLMLIYLIVSVLGYFNWRREFANSAIETRARTS